MTSLLQASTFCMRIYSDSLDNLVAASHYLWIQFHLYLKFKKVYRVSLQIIVETS
jgi:hypothetical protein